MPTPQEVRAASARLQQESDQAVALLAKQQTDLVTGADALKTALEQAATAMAESAAKDELIAAGNEMLATVGGVVTALDAFTPEGTPIIEPTP
jgi:hypothetical protein